LRSVEPGEQNWTGIGEIRWCLFFIVLMIVARFLGHAMDDIERRLEGRNHPVILER